MIVSNRKSLAKRVQRILRVNDLHIPVSGATRDLGIEAAGLKYWLGKTTKQPNPARREFGLPSIVEWSSTACRPQT